MGQVLIGISLVPHTIYSINYFKRTFADTTSHKVVVSVYGLNSNYLSYIVNPDVKTEEVIKCVGVEDSIK